MYFATSTKNKQTNASGIDLSEKLSIEYYVQNQRRMAPSIPVERDEVCSKSHDTKEYFWQMNLITVLCY